MLNGKVVLITGGTGSFGKAFTRFILNSYTPRKVIIYSRDEFKQFQMKQEFSEFSSQIRFFIGDVRDRIRLERAFDGVDYVVHAAALKQVPACEYNPLEAVKTNINGAEYIIEAAINRKVKKVVALSTDKAVNPVNLYGATKLVSDKLFINGNAYSGNNGTIFSVVRYGNVMGSRGSVIPFFQKLIDKQIKELPITDNKMTRFWITLQEGIELVIKALQESRGAEIYISNLSSFKVIDLAKAMAPNIPTREIGIREGEKVHELLISEGEIRNTYQYGDYFIVYPEFDWWNTKEHFHLGGIKVSEDYVYSSGSSDKLMDIEELKIKISSLNCPGNLQ